MSKFWFFGFTCLLGCVGVAGELQPLNNPADRGLTTTGDTDGIDPTQPSASLNPSSAGNTGLPSSSPSGILFEDQKQQRQYETILKKLRSMKRSSGGESREDDWFVLGGTVGNQSNFNTFQGEEYVAQRIVEFMSLNNNRCQWRVFSREENSSVAQEMVSQVKTSYLQWKQAEYNRLVANYRAQQQRAAAYQRAAASCRRPGGG
jgi:hypothetical protein